MGSISDPLIWIDAWHLSGDETAAGHLTNWMFPYIESKIRRFASSHDRDDLLQIVLMKVFSRVKHHDTVESLLAWLRCVTINTCRDHYRSSRTRNKYFVRCQVEDDPQVDFEKLRAVSLAELDIDFIRWRCFDSLASVDQQILRLLYAERMSVAEISAAMGISHGAIKARAHRARQKARTLEKELRRFS